jgi:hypothetical protein
VATPIFDVVVSHSKIFAYEQRLCPCPIASICSCCSSNFPKLKVHLTPNTPPDSPPNDAYFLRLIQTLRSQSRKCKISLSAKTT